MVIFAFTHLLGVLSLYRVYQLGFTKAKPRPDFIARTWPALLPLCFYLWTFWNTKDELIGIVCAVTYPLLEFYLFVFILAHKAMSRQKS